jgi:prophage regulatory protein
MSKYLRFRDLKPLKGIPFSRQHIRRLQRVSKFPQSVPFGDNTEVFIDEEIDQWVADRLAERDARAAALVTQHALLESSPTVQRCGTSQKLPRARLARTRAPASPTT